MCVYLCMRKHMCTYTHIMWLHGILIQLKVRTKSAALPWYFSFLKCEWIEQYSCLTHKNAIENQLHYINENNLTMYKERVLVQAAIINYHWLSVLNNKLYFLRILEAKKYEIRLPAMSDYREGPLPISFIWWRKRERKQAVASSFIRAVIPFMGASHLSPKCLTS